MAENVRARRSSLRRAIIISTMNFADARSWNQKWIGFGVFLSIVAMTSTQRYATGISCGSAIAPTMLMCSSASANRQAVATSLRAAYRRFPPTSFTHNASPAMLL